MKNSIPSKFKHLPLTHITGEQVKFLATEADCEENYVRKIVSARRPINSALAKIIYKAAKKLNRHIENGQQKAKEIIIVGEND
ncbi:hypothetical protein [Aurantibacillus circumpalustris]|uniref:hypothetical protein n=1 Tax=Aurantibacillus circumpalustris TaxID=3036359 RepID=UPI00295A7392|nr:hypothetical protein [Aurantibacillus circumpalustris]